jgi:hypothetical protein
MKSLVLSKTDKWVALVAIVTVVVFIVAYSVFILPSPPTLYGNIEIRGYASYTVPDPTIKLSIDVNGDGTNEISRTYNSTTYRSGSAYLLKGESQIFEYNIVLDSGAENWTFTVQVLNGSTPLHFDGDKDQVTFICNMSVSTQDELVKNQFCYDPPLGIPTNCRLLVSWHVLSMLTPVH